MKGDEVSDTRQEDETQDGIFDSPLGRQMFCCSFAFLSAIGLESKTGNSRYDYSSALRTFTILSSFGVSGVFLYYIGRKKFIILQNITLVGVTLLDVLDNNWKYGFLLSCAFDFVWVTQYPAAIIYISEVTDKKLRAAFIGVYSLMRNWGEVLRFLFEKSKLEFVFPLTMRIMSLVLAFLIPESPYWLVVTGNREAADKIYEWLHGSGSDLTEGYQEFDRIEANAQLNRTGVLKGLPGNVFNKRFLWRWIIMLFVFFTDIDMVDELLTEAHTDILSPLANDILNSEVHNKFFDDNYGYKYGLVTVNYAQVFGWAMKTMANIAFIFLNLILPRRIIFIGSVSIIVSLFIAPYFYKYQKVDVYYLFLVSYIPNEIGNRQIAELLPAEIFPSITREIGTMLSFFMFNFDRRAANNCKSFRPLPICSKASYRHFRSFLIPIGLVFVIFYMPETKDLTLLEAEEAANEMQVLFGADLFGDPYEEEEEVL